MHDNLEKPLKLHNNNHGKRISECIHRRYTYIRLSTFHSPTRNPYGGRILPTCIQEFIHSDSIPKSTEKCKRHDFER